MKLSLNSFLLIPLATLFTCASLPAIADAHHEKPSSFVATKITNDIYMLQGKGGNIAVLNGAQGTLVIDDDYQDMSPALNKALSPFGGTDALRYIINTHWHGDHTGGNLSLGHSAAIVAHDNVRQRLLTKQEIELFNMVSQPYPQHALPSITYQQRLSLHFNNEEIQLIHLANGHTDGDSVVLFKDANVIHMGDHFFNGFFPFIDLGTGGNAVTMAANVGAILETIDKDTIVIPGHGPLANKQDLQAFHAMLIGTTKEVMDMKQAGMSLEKIQQKGLSETWDSWTDGFLSTDVWIQIVDGSL